MIATDRTISVTPMTMIKTILFPEFVGDVEFFRAVVFFGDVVFVGDGVGVGAVVGAPLGELLWDRYRYRRGIVQTARGSVQSGICMGFGPCNSKETGRVWL